MRYLVDTVELRKEMAEHGITTIGQLADISGVDRNTVSKVLNCKCRPSTSVMEKIASSLNLQPCRAGAIFFKPDLRNA